MVGGRSFSVHGQMCCGVTSGGLLVRVGADGIAAALDQPHVSRMTMGDRSLAAFVVVAPAGVASDSALSAWVQRGVQAVTGEDQSASAAQRYGELVQSFAGTAGVTVPEDRGGVGFGSSALKADGSIFAMLTGDHLVVKLPRVRVAELIDAGTGGPFTAGKTVAMKEWLTVITEDRSTWLALAQEALAFVRNGKTRPPGP